MKSVHNSVAAVALVCLAASVLVSAQPPGGPPGGLFGGALPETLQPPQEFANSTDHYRALRELYDGGVVHTEASVPKWPGIWSPAANNSGNRLFANADGIIPDVLTPEYEAAFQYRRDLGVDYDRLTSCEPAGLPRWFLEPYTREFVNTPVQSWWMNDLGNDTRRIYINQEHRNVDGTHYAAGDSIGFWAVDQELGDILVVHTVDLYPADYFRGTPPTSNQFETVEIWYEYDPDTAGADAPADAPANTGPNIAANVTFYDELSLIRPITVVYTFRRRADIEELGYRIRHWECDSNDNTYLIFDDDGVPSTQYRLPGEDGFIDPRGADRMRNPDLPPGLIGQEKNPIFDDGLTDFEF